MVEIKVELDIFAFEKTLPMASYCDNCKTFGSALLRGSLFEESSGMYGQLSEARVRSWTGGSSDSCSSRFVVGFGGGRFSGFSATSGGGGGDASGLQEDSAKLSAAMFNK